MTKLKKHNISIPSGILLFILLFTSCQGQTEKKVIFQTATAEIQSDDTNLPTPYPIREQYPPGELVDYEVQTGDTLPALAIHFNTTIDEIREVNPIIPDDVTTLPPGLPLKIPIYFQSLWGGPYQIIPDSQYVNGPSQVDFDTVAFVDSHQGWLKNAIDYPGGYEKRGGEIIDHLAQNYSVSPTLLLAILEYQSGALTNPVIPENTDYILGMSNRKYKGLNQQLVLACNTLNHAYYGWRTGKFTEFEHLDGRLEHPDPWQNAATVAIQYFFSQVLIGDDFQVATQGDGLAKTYQDLFGDPWINDAPHIPGSLEQPQFLLPFELGKSWTLTGGPHTGWGNGYPWAAIDFAPAGVSGCQNTSEWATAIADGVVARTGTGFIVVDLDMDQDERTGWSFLYLHLDKRDRAELGNILHAGDPVGHPSCEGGSSTGTHIHIARKYNGEWIPAGGPLAFNLEGWIAQFGDLAYEGKLVRYDRVVTASDVSDIDSMIQSDREK